MIKNLRKEVDILSLVTLTINNNHVQVEEGTTVLQAAKLLGINIPTLCHLNLHQGVENKPGSCRVCMVEIEGRKNLAPSCTTPAANGMIVKTNSIKAIKARRNVVELLLSDHPQNCLLCEKNTNCELQSLAADMGIREVKYKGEMSTYPKDTSNYSITRDLDKCILCRRCETICNEVQTVSALSAVNRGFGTIISPAFGLPLLKTNCTFCGQCVSVCPTGALTEVNNASKVWNALNDKDKLVIVQTAPAVRAALGEEFGLEIGKAVTGKMAAALRRMGFDKVFDTDFGADLTIMEEGFELLDRIQNGGKLPMVTSCSPGWIKYCEHFHPDMLENLSTCKSPHEMLGAVMKTYFAQKHGLDPKDIFVVSVMPCTAKKFEAKREELRESGFPDVDAVITTRELAKMIKQASIDFNKLPDEDFDEVFGESTGASVIFGVTGGVMEAALRTVSEVVTNKPLEKIEFNEVRGLEGIKEAEITLGDKNIKIAVANSTGYANKLLEKVKSGEKEYHFIEIMGCPGGCINGGGQPFVSDKTKTEEDVLGKRANALYEEDESKTIRKSHENPMIKMIYDEFFEKPNSHKAHEILHTHYVKRPKYTE